MRSMKLLSSSSGTIWTVLRIVERAIIEGCNRRLSTPISSVRDWPLLACLMERKKPITGRLCVLAA
jgi:hypothetical protein